MKPTALLINTSRGDLVDENALIQVLRNQKIAGAGLDVFPKEPHVSPELKALDHVVLTPHISAYTKEAREQMAMIALERFVDDFLTT